MKRSPSELQRLIRAQQALADLARREHGEIAAAIAAKNDEIAALDERTSALEPDTLPLLDLYVERARTLAGQRVTLGRRQVEARARIAGETARVRPLDRALREAQQVAERKGHEVQISETIDRQFAQPNQASRKPRAR